MTSSGREAPAIERQTFSSDPDEYLTLLAAASDSGRTDATCHRLWSRFIRARDRNRCVICEATDGVAAHHVIRRSFMREARFQTGNGASLCRKCHDRAHAGFNGKADFGLPVDYQGGEKLEAIGELFRLLAKAAREQHPGRDDFYFLSEPVLSSFMIMQGFDPGKRLKGSAIEQAWWIWDCAPLQIVEALVRANLPADR